MSETKHKGRTEAKKKEDLAKSTPDPGWDTMYMAGVGMWAGSWQYHEIDMIVTRKWWKEQPRDRPLIKKLVRKYYTDKADANGIIAELA
jgi:hypothetical protein